MVCFIDGRLAWAGKGWAEHLQHCFPWTDQAGYCRLCRERASARQTQVSGMCGSLFILNYILNKRWILFVLGFFCPRQRYQALLDRIPRRLKALHTETVAQKSLGRRLTEEIHRIKSSLQQLSMYVGQDQIETLWSLIHIAEWCSKSK